MQIINTFSKLSLAVAAAMALASQSAAAPLLIPFPGTGGSTGGCGSYTIINTRGTGELQGPSIGFRTMTRDTLAQVSGGQTYNTNYPAGFTQISTAGTNDILAKVKSKLAQCPDHKFALLGYSQGAAATTEALVRGDDAFFNAVKAVLVVGNPRRKRGLQCDVDAQGGQATKNAQGLQAFQGGIPTKWDQSGKVVDICAFGDGVCDAATFAGISIPHLLYGTNSWVQKRGTELMVGAFKA